MNYYDKLLIVFLGPPVFIVLLVVFPSTFLCIKDRFDMSDSEEQRDKRQERRLKLIKLLTFVRNAFAILFLFTSTLFFVFDCLILAASPCSFVGSVPDLPCCQFANTRVLCVPRDQWHQLPGLTFHLT